MDGPKRILILEDNSADAELMKRELRRAGTDFRVEWAKNKEDFASALETSIPDLILADYSLPGFDGLSALRLAREKWTDIPVVIVSGAIGEVFAVETLKAGATDYVLKQNLNRLGPVVVRALDEVRERNEKNLAEEALRRSEERSRLLIEGVRDYAIFMLDARGQITSWNSGAGRLYGWAAPEILGRHFSVFYPTTREKSESELILEQAILNGSFKEQGERISKDGRRFWADVTISPLRNEKGQVYGFAKVTRDITDRKRIEEELKAAKVSAEKAKSAAEQANRAKDHFLAVLSHELRTPLTPVVMAVSVLQDRQGVDPEMREMLEIIRRNVEMEARLIDDLLDVTRIARGKIDLNRSTVDLCAVIKRAVEVCMPDIETRRLDFGVDYGPAAPYWVEADVARLQQVFWNLLKNAIKFTPHGGCVGIRCRSNKEHVYVEVNDSGIGIASEDLARVFDAFEQAEVSISRQFGGLGLGLAISKALVEMHGGRIEALSQGRNRGATFRVHLPLRAPLKQVEAQKPVISPEPVLRPLRILLVEDHGITAKMIRKVLSEKGHRIETAGDVATALELAGRHTFDLLLSDLGLPDGSGHDLLRELRARGYGFPGIALSGYGQEEDIRRSRQAGFVSHLTKPGSREAIDLAISSAVSGNETAWLVAGQFQPLTSVFDPEAALSRCFGQRETLNEMIAFFRKDSMELLEKIRSAVERGDTAEAAQAAHRLKGSAIYLGAQPTADAAQRLEKSAKSGDLESTRQSILELEHQIELLKQALPSIETNPESV